MTQHRGGQNGGRLSDLVRDVLEESPQAARAYLRESWLSTAIRALREARWKAGLTQADIAERMGTSQPAVARLENDQEGRTTLHRYVDYALACGTLPLNVVLEPADSVREFAIDQPRAPRTQICYQVWAEQVQTPSVTGAARSVGQTAAVPQMFNVLLPASGQSLLRGTVGAFQPPFAWRSFHPGQRSTTTALAADAPPKLGEEGHPWLAGQNSPPANSPVLAA